MTDEQIHNIYLHMSGKAEGIAEATGSADFPVLFARAILEFSQPEPDYEAEFIKDWKEGKVKRVSDGKRMVPEREWVGLTDEEIADLDCVRLDEIGYGDLALNEKSVTAFARALEFRLRNKNT